MKVLLIILIPLALTLQCRCAEGSGKLILDIKKDYVRLTNGKMKAWNIPGKLITYFSGPYGYFGSSGFNYPLDKIIIEKNTDQEKKVSFISKIQRTKSKGGRSAVFIITLSANAKSPGVELKAEIKNVGKYPSFGYFYYRFAGLKFPYYDNPNGWQCARRKKIPVPEWFFLPSANKNGGYGLIPFDPENIKITTLYPRSDWMPVGFCFSHRKKRQLKPGETSMLGFRIFPAISKWEVLKYYDSTK